MPKCSTLSVGTWAIEYERGRRVENGTATSVMGTGALTVAPEVGGVLSFREPSNDDQ